jgi:phenylpropionate dioxygenase-like ring-hydroxylating dioxygenase large terminal subunit
MFQSAALTSELAEALDAVRQPVGRAKGLPNALYNSPEALALEREKIFHSGWASVGFGCDVPNAGDAMPIDYLGAPLLLLRDKSGQIRVFENVCRHRGMILVEEKKNFGGVIRCPYHSWCYSLDGKLRATPHVGGPGINTHESVNPDTTGLTEVRSAVLQDVVFVNLDGKARSFEEWSAGLRAQLADFIGRPIFYGGPESTFSFDLNTNWKLVVDNNAESYHLPWVHPGLNSYSRLEDHYHLDERGGFSGQGTLVYNPNYGPKSFPNFADLPTKWDRSAEYPCFYPNTFFSVHRDHVWAAHLDPKSHDRTVERINIYYTTEEAATSPEFHDMRVENAARWKEVLTEDVFVTEGMQKGRGAPGFAGGVFSAVMDSPTHCFHNWVAERIAS